MQVLAVPGWAKALAVPTFLCQLQCLAASPLLRYQQAPGTLVPYKPGLARRTVGVSGWAATRIWPSSVLRRCALLPLRSSWKDSVRVWHAHSVFERAGNGQLGCSHMAPLPLTRPTTPGPPCCRGQQPGPAGRRYHWQCQFQECSDCSVGRPRICHDCNRETSWGFPRVRWHSWLPHLRSDHSWRGVLLG